MTLQITQRCQACHRMMDRDSNFAKRLVSTDQKTRRRKFQWDPFCKECRTRNPLIEQTIKAQLDPSPRQLER